MVMATLAPPHRTTGKLAYRPQIPPRVLAEMVFLHQNGQLEQVLIKAGLRVRFKRGVSKALAGILLQNVRGYASSMRFPAVDLPAMTINAESSKHVRTRTVKSI